MTRHVVVGTAGHVDHGKTALVKALTGVDTDRWAEEKRRGITIDLGFAPLDLGDGLAASVVDVPGHEDFVRNMVAGATGVDVALLVVAVDEGVMPQTVEHLAILELLGVATGVVAIAKSDLAEAEWLELVRADVAQRVAESPVHWEEPVTVSSVTGAGLDDVRAALARAAARAVARSADDLFRLPVDRVFSVAGAGTVVTGTTWAGSVGVGDEVRILPGPVRARVRSVEVHGRAAERAVPGRRTALALPGVSKDAVARGSVVVVDERWRETATLDVMLTLLPEARRLSQRTRVRVLLGTAEVMARVTPAGDAIAPGTTGPARLRLEGPVVARWGDRAVLRSYSPVTTIGGCVVVDPTPPPRPRRPVGLEARAVPDPAARIGAFLAVAGRRGLPLDDLVVRVGVHPNEVDAALAPAGDRLRRAAGRLIAAATIEALGRETLAALDGYHRQHPLEPGMPRELVRAAVEPQELADAVLQALAVQGRVAVEGGTARLAGFQPALAGGRQRDAAALRAALEAAGAEGKTVGELGDVPDARAVLEYFVRQGTAVRVGLDRYYDRSQLERLRDQILDEIRRRGRATPAELRDRTGLTRKYLIPVLEWLDGAGYTVRDGDARRPGPRAVSAPSDA